MKLLIVPYIFSAAILFTQLYRWKRTARFFGRMPTWLFWDMFRIALRTPKAYFLYSATLCAAWIIALLLFGSRLGIAFPPSIATLMLVTCLATPLWVCQPPSVLLLASTSPQSANLLHTINFAISPLRAVSLLDYGRLTVFSRRSSENNLRISNLKVWRNIVHRLIDIAPIVVVDTRTEAEAVAYETLLMLAPERVSRAVFVGNGAGECPSLKTHGIDPRVHALQTVSEDELIERLIGWTRGIDTPLRQGVLPTNRSKPCQDENWQSLPSILMLGMPDGFDSEWIISMARQTDKDLIGLMLPLPGPDLTSERAQKALDLLWEFIHDEQLALIFLETDEQIMIRRRFLLEASASLDAFIAVAPSKPLTWEQLFEPDPMLKAIRGFLGQLQKMATERGYTFRTIR